MPGGQYVALSALRTRLHQLDTLADDLSNAQTSGYRGSRTAQVATGHQDFEGSLRSAVDGMAGPTRIDMTTGTINPTGRALDVALEGSGFFVVESRDGMEYTRNGHFQRAEDGTLVAADGAVVQGADGPITLGNGEPSIDDKGRVWSGAQMVGQLKVVNIPDPGAMTRGVGARLRATGQESGIEDIDPDELAVRPASLEASNVPMAEGLARLTSVARNFEALQRSISTMLNEVDGRFIDNMARR